MNCIPPKHGAGVAAKVDATFELSVGSCYRLAYLQSMLFFRNVKAWYSLREVRIVVLQGLSALLYNWDKKYIVCMQKGRKGGGF